MFDAHDTQKICSEATFYFGPFRLTPGARLLTCTGREVAIGGRAFDILVVLLRNSGKVVSHQDLLDAAWPGVFVEETNLRVQVFNLRRALKARDPVREYIKTVTGRGYVLVQDVAASYRSTGAARRSTPHFVPTAP